MAEVQLALQRGPAGFEKLVVVKLVHDTLATQKAFVDMLLDEARVAALVKHPNVVDIYDLGQANGRYFIAMEYLEGEPLLSVLRAGKEGKRLDVLSTGRLIADTAEGLDAAHELRSMSGDRLELVHHDISLGNIVVLYNGQVKLVDFGVAKATQSAAGPKSRVQGKFSYMAPEKLRGKPGDRRSDIFSLGCVMWEALTLKRLFRGSNDTETMKQVLEATIEPPSKVNTEVPAEYDAIVMRALDRDPDKRQRTAKELAVEVEELLRKRGYGAKNDKIARYMQDTFKEHIGARKKLVQEVVNKGSASAEVLDAAFNDPILASGSPLPPRESAAEFSVKYHRVTPSRGIAVRPLDWGDADPGTRVETPKVHAMFDAGSGTETEIAPLPDTSTAVDEPRSLARGSVSLGARARAITNRAKTIATPMARRVRDTTNTILADRRKLMIFAIGTGVLVGLAIILGIATSPSERSTAAASDGSASVAAGSDEVVTAGSGEIAATGSETSATGSDEIEMDPVEVGSSNDTRATDVEKTDKATKVDKSDKVAKVDKTDKAVKTEKADKIDKSPKVEKTEKTEKVETAVKTEPVEKTDKPAIDVVDTVNQGLKAFVTGDSKGALALLKQAKAAKPGYAPTYRVLGKVYKKLGDTAAAKTAYQRYLKLAPTAPDAPQIRKEVEEL
jgi:serine/threonine-protein kinase